MTDEINQTLSRITNHLEALTVSLDRFEAHLERLEETQAEDRQRAIEERRRQDEAQSRADARIARLERVVRLVVRLGDRERKDLRQQMAALAEAQIKMSEAVTQAVDRLGRNGEGGGLSP